MLGIWHFPCMFCLLWWTTGMHCSKRIRIVCFRSNSCSFQVDHQCCFWLERSWGARLVTCFKTSSCKMLLEKSSFIGDVPWQKNTLWLNGWTFSASATRNSRETRSVPGQTGGGRFCMGRYLRFRLAACEIKEWKKVSFCFFFWLSFYFCRGNWHQRLYRYASVQRTSNRFWMSATRGGSHQQDSHKLRQSFCFGQGMNLTTLQVFCCCTHVCIQLGAQIHNSKLHRHSKRDRTPKEFVSTRMIDHVQAERNNGRPNNKKCFTNQCELKICSVQKLAKSLILFIFLSWFL